ncbi:MAG: rhodanese-like domain-containing protein [Desulfatiglandales bacterium]
MKGIGMTMVYGLMGLLLIAVSPGPAFGAKKTQAFPDIPRISAKELQSMLGLKGLIILDVRPLQQWEDSEEQIPGARHEDHTAVDSWAQKYSKKDTIVVTY